MNETDNSASGEEQFRQEVVTQEPVATTAPQAPTSTQAPRAVGAMTTGSLKPGETNSVAGTRGPTEIDSVSGRR